ncbi:hypothetical protein PPTG_21760 [Phytophthora nicotianae INRA-310]|uniref:Uncharacterized protein n=1 Tax=Phytophthora nicotianae (strain INRA-310) TaxID=761204 RepID=W2QW39_PHYN3|nr:hypothetical protein PPTG_21760 [Phytophthora nicotianae INRA-310]ETN16694.1 hypothetical protein PPTG_21760 [Phytophthora nicotianae INRA-310]
MRRHDVNIKFEMLVNVLGLASRACKKNILHEAASAIKGLKKWQNLVLQATTDAVNEEKTSIVEPAGPMVDHPQYDPPKSNLKRPAAVSNQIAKVFNQKEDENTAEEVSKGYATEGPIKTKPIKSV